MQSVSDENHNISERPKLVFRWTRPYIENQTRGGTSICFNVDGTQLMAGFVDGETILLDVKSRKPIAKLDGNETQETGEPLQVATLKPIDMARCAVVYSGVSSTENRKPEETLVLWNFKNGETKRLTNSEFPAFPGLHSSANVSVSSDGSEFLCETIDPPLIGIHGVNQFKKNSILTTRSTSDGNVRRRFVLENKLARSACLAPNQLAVLGLRTKNLANTDDVLAKSLKMPPGKAANQLDLNPEPMLAVVDLKANKSAVFNLGHRLDVVGIQALENGRSCVSVSMEGLIVVWDLEDGSIKNRFWTGCGCNYLASGNGSNVVAVGNAREIRMFNLATGDFLDHFEVANKGFQPAYGSVPKDGKFKQVSRVAVGPDLPHHLIGEATINVSTNRLSVIYLDGLIEIWEFPKTKPREKPPRSKLRSSII